MKKLIVLVLVVSLVVSAIATAELVFRTESGERVNVRDKPKGGDVIWKFASEEPLPSGSYYYGSSRYAVPLPDGRIGYVYSGLVSSGNSNSKTPVVTQPAGISKGYIKPDEGANMRDNPSFSGRVVGFAPCGECVTISGKSGNWYLIYLSSGRSGYVWADLVSETMATATTMTVNLETVTVVSKKGINLRDRPTMDSNVKTTVAPGTVLEFLGAVNSDWVKIEYEGRPYYVNAALVK